MITRESILRWQNAVRKVIPNVKEAWHLDVDGWDMLPSGMTWLTASEEEARRAIRFFGPAAYRIVRWSHLPTTIPSKVHILGGACPLTQADCDLIGDGKMPGGGKVAHGSSKQLLDLIETLPTIQQVSDGIMGLAAPGATERRLLYVHEDKLFAERAERMFAFTEHDREIVLEAFKRQGERAKKLAVDLAELHTGRKFESRTVSYDDLAEEIAAGLAEFLETQAFMNSIRGKFFNPEAVRRLMGFIDRTKVMYSYTQHFFENVLVPRGLTSPDALWIIAEPFHHFSYMPAHSRLMTEKERIGMMYQACADYFTAEPYGRPGSANERVVLVATLPSVVSNDFAFRMEPTSQQPKAIDKHAFLARLREDAAKPLNDTHPLIVTAMNLGWFDECVREHVLSTTAAYYEVNSARKLLMGFIPKDADGHSKRKSLSDMIRTILPENASVREALELLLEENEKVVLQLT